MGGALPRLGGGERCLLLVVVGDGVGFDSLSFHSLEVFAGGVVDDVDANEGMDDAGVVHEVLHRPDEERDHVGGLSAAVVLGDGFREDFFGEGG